LYQKYFLQSYGSKLCKPMGKVTALVTHIFAQVADFVPPPDFLVRTLPFFHDPTVAMVQTLWGHVNREYSLLTRAQSLGIDGHFWVEQAA